MSVLLSTVAVPWTTTGRMIQHFLPQGARRVWLRQLDEILRLPEVQR